MTEGEATLVYNVRDGQQYVVLDSGAIFFNGHQVVTPVSAPGVDFFADLEAVLEQMKAEKAVPLISKETFDWYGGEVPSLPKEESVMADLRPLTWEGFEVRPTNHGTEASVGHRKLNHDFVIMDYEDARALTQSDDAWDKLQGQAYMAWFDAMGLTHYDEPPAIPDWPLGTTLYKVSNPDQFAHVWLIPGHDINDPTGKVLTCTDGEVLYLHPSEDLSKFNDYAPLED